MIEQVHNEAKFIGGNVDWTVSKSVLNRYNMGVYKEYSRDKLNWHRDNYQLNKPKGDRLDTPYPVTRVESVGQYGNRNVRYDPVAKAKSFIFTYMAVGGDRKELIENYLFYISNRKPSDRLNMGRIPGNTRGTPKADRELIIAIHGKSCVMCGDHREIEIHHIESVQKNRDIDNQIPVCKKCHCAIHNT